MSKPYDVAKPPSAMREQRTGGREWQHSSATRGSRHTRNAGGSLDRRTGKFPIRSWREQDCKNRRNEVPADSNRCSQRAEPPDSRQSQSQREHRGYLRTDQREQRYGRKAVPGATAGDVLRGAGGCAIEKKLRSHHIAQTLQQGGNSVTAGDVLSGAPLLSRGGVAARSRKECEATSNGADGVVLVEKSLTNT